MASMSGPSARSSSSWRNHSAICCTMSASDWLFPIANAARDFCALGERPGSSKPLGSTIVCFKLFSTQPLRGTVHAVLTSELLLVLAAGIEGDGGLGGVALASVAVTDVSEKPDGGASAVAEESTPVAGADGTSPLGGGVVASSRIWSSGSPSGFTIFSQNFSRTADLRRSHADVSCSSLINCLQDCRATHARSPGHARS